ncbi:MAG: Dyp-type peroxidase family [Pseudonocardiales bacterium]|nr:Dyp-type peroxidase family [Pseudonocardiales bacterium]
MTDNQRAPADDAAPRRRPSRRAFLGGAVGGGALLAGGAAGFAIGQAVADPDPGPHPSAGLVDFYGEHQAGIATPSQDRVAFAAFDVTTRDVERLKGMLGLWAAAAARTTTGRLIGTTEDNPHAPPVDTGEALGLSPAQLTITVGFGPSLFDERFGLAGRKPAALEDIPALPADVLQAALVGGDLCVQACSNDPQVAFHVIRNFARIGRGTVVLRWSQLGFGRTSTTSTGQSTPRNLMGFKDGTNNIKAENQAQMDDFVWVGDETDQDWMKGGSYLVSRRIRMLIEAWDADFIADQERIFGRKKESGAPLTGKAEFDPIDFSAKGADGALVIDPVSHVRLASPEENSGLRILRRGFSYTDGIDARTGQLDAGLFFICFQKDPRTQFVPLQRKLGSMDSLNEYIKHTGSAVFAVPPGVREVGDWFGKALFTS